MAKTSPLLSNVTRTLSVSTPPGFVQGPEVLSAYPCEAKLVNLSRINELKEITKKIGLSDHSSGIQSSVFAFGMGVTLIEKRFTVDNKLPGRDNKFAILPKDLKELIDKSKEFYEMYENKKNNFIKQELEIRKVYTGRWIK